MRLRDQDMPLDPDVELELAAIEAGLTGLAVTPDLEDVAQLARDARAQRSAPEPSFAAEMDEWAAAGFPPARRPGNSPPEDRESGARSMRERLAGIPPRRLLAPVGAAATLLVAVAVAISVSDQIGGSGTTVPQADSVQSVPPASQGSGGSGQAGAPSPGRASRNLPESSTADQLSIRGAARNASPTVGDLAKPQSFGNFDSAVGPRKVEQNADLVLSTDPQNVRHVADGVVQVVDQYNGYVVSSDVTSGSTPGPVPLRGDAQSRSAQQGSGRFELRIPAGHLQAALADLSRLAHVTSRTEGVKDITKRFNSAEQQVKDLEVQRTHLLHQLADALTITEEDSIKQQLAIVEHQLAGAKNHLGDVQQRIHMVRMSVEVLGQRGIDAGGGGGSWSIGDALHDAGRVLTVLAGILLISAAVLVPLGVLVALAWVTAHALIRRRREGALD